MNLHINEEALKWYKDELDLKKGDQVRFFVRYGGCGNVQKGFSLGVSKDEPQRNRSKRRSGRHYVFH